MNETSPAMHPTPPRSQKGIEHRRSRRKHAASLIQVTNVLTDEMTGRVGNLSNDGMMLIASHPIPDGALFQFNFHLPAQRHPIEIGVQAQWTSSIDAYGQYRAGFRIIDISNEHFAALTQWLNVPES